MGGPPPGYQPVPASGGRQGNGIATASMVLGIVGLPLCFLFVPSILAVVFGFIGLNRSKEGPNAGGRGQAIAGLVLGIVTLALLLVAIAFGDTNYRFDS